MIIIRCKKSVVIQQTGDVAFTIAERYEGERQQDGTVFVLRNEQGYRHFLPPDFLEEYFDIVEEN